MARTTHVDTWSKRYATLRRTDASLTSSAEGEGA